LRQLVHGAAPFMHHMKLRMLDHHQCSR
jgi:hypothetical protein